MENLQQAGGRAGGVHRVSALLVKEFSSGLYQINMLVCIMSQPSSITNQILPGTPELLSFNCPKLGFPLSKSKFWSCLYQTW